MEPKYLIDTNVLIDAQMNNLPETGMKFLKKIIDTDFTVSFITYIEFPGYREITKGTEGFISLSNVLEINKEIKFNTASGYAKPLALNCPMQSLPPLQLVSDYI